MFGYCPPRVLTVSPFVHVVHEKQVQVHVFLFFLCKIHAFVTVNILAWACQGCLTRRQSDFFFFFF